MSSVLFVAPSAYPLGGLATWLDYLLPGLASRGWEATLALTAGDHHDAAAYSREHPQARTITVANPTGSHEGRIRALANAISEVKPHVVASVNIADACSAAVRLRETNAHSPRMAMTLHGIQPDLIADAAAARDALDAVVCTNRLAVRLVAEAGVPASRIHYAPYGVDLDGLDVRERAPASRLRIAYVGRIERWQKRTEDLPGIADALAALGVDFELAVAGSGPDEPQLRRAMASHERDGRVRFLGALDPARLEDEIYRTADVLLITSQWETGPLVAWEAMAHGVAVVSSRYIGSGLEGALRDGENALLFPVGDCPRAAACLSRLRSPALRKKIAEGGRTLVAGRYTRPHSVDAWDRCLTAIAQAPTRAAAAEPFPALPTGRLDRAMGPRRAEIIRRALRRRHAHAGPGGEWPHAYSSRPIDDPDFWELAARLDREQP